MRIAFASATRANFLAWKASAARPNVNARRNASKASVALAMAPTGASFSGPDFPCLLLAHRWPTSTNVSIRTSVAANTPHIGISAKNRSISRPEFARLESVRGGKTQGRRDMNRSAPRASRQGRHCPLPTQSGHNCGVLHPQLFSSELRAAFKLLGQPA